MLAVSCECSQDTLASEICPHCFAPKETVAPLFSKEIEPAHGGVLPSIASPVTPVVVSLREERFVPSSSLALTLKGMRRAIVSGLVAVLLVGGLVAWGAHSFKNSTLQADQRAQEAFQAERYAEATKIWSSALHRSKMIFDKGGQVKALRGMARCEIRQQQFSEALSTLRRAEKLESGPEIREQIEACSRLSAAHRLKRSQDFLKPGQLGLAMLEAKAAVVDFQNGKASPGQIAGAHRMVGRCALQLGDLEQVQAQLDLAVKLEGKTAANVVLSTELGRALASVQKRLSASDRQARQRKAAQVKKRPTPRAPHPESSKGYGQILPPQITYPDYSAYRPVVYPSATNGYSSYQPARKVVDARLPEAPPYPTYQGPTYGTNRPGVDPPPIHRTGSVRIPSIPGLRFP